MSLYKNNAHDSDSQFVEKTARDLTLTLSHFSTSDWHEIETGLVDLIYKSLDLDEELSRQVASITFSSSISLLSQPFHSDTMLCVSNYEAKDGDSKYVSLVIAPGLWRRGQFSGEQFDLRIRLMKTDVACGVPLPDRSDQRRTFVEGPTIEGPTIEGRTDRIPKVERGNTDSGRWNPFHRSYKR